MMYTAEERERIAYIQGQDNKVFAQLATLENLKDSRDNAIAKIGEAIGCFPAEDFLQETIDACQNIRGRVTKTDLLPLAEKLEELQNKINQQSEYGRSELDDAVNGF